MVPDKKKLGAQIDALREANRHTEADALQYNGKRCNVCEGSPSNIGDHRCWVTPLGFMTSNSMDPAEVEEHEEWVKEVARGG
jgi:hypothetical protein